MLSDVAIYLVSHHQKFFSLYFQVEENLSFCVDINLCIRSIKD